MSLLSGHKIRGHKLISRKDFSSIPSLILDFDTASQVVVNGSNQVISWTDKILGAKISRTVLDNDSILSSGQITIQNSVSLSGGLNSYSQSILSQFLGNDKQKGFFWIGELINGGTSRNLLRGDNPSIPHNVIFRTLNSAGNSRISFTATPGSYVGSGDLPVSTLMCVSYIFGEIGPALNMKMYFNSTLFGSQTRSSTTNFIYTQLNMFGGPAGFGMKINRVLLYDWQGKTDSQIASLNSEVRSLITRDYGITF